MCTYGAMNSDRQIKFANTNWEVIRQSQSCPLYCSLFCYLVLFPGPALEEGKGLVWIECFLGVLRM